MNASKTGGFSGSHGHTSELHRIVSNGSDDTQSTQVSKQDQQDNIIMANQSRLHMSQSRLLGTTMNTTADVTSPDSILSTSIMNRSKPVILIQEDENMFSSAQDLSQLLQIGNQALPPKEAMFNRWKQLIESTLPAIDLIDIAAEKHAYYP